MRRRGPIVAAGLAVLCLCLLIVALAPTDRRNVLVRIQNDINRQGYAPFPGYKGMGIRAQTARVTDEGLLLEASNEPGKAPEVLTYLLANMDPMGICSAKSVSVQLVADPYERLKLTFHSPNSGPRFMMGSTQYIPLPRGGKAYQWFCTIRFGIRDFILRVPPARPSQPSPPSQPAGPTP
ncbi:MAG: hypothetical protein ABFE01_08370 [Phycisphaerales bacterium]|jgi:hypothetical protein